MNQGDRIKAIRKQLGLSMEKFGERLGVGKTAIAKIEHGENKLTDQMAISICREYRVNYDYLVYGDDTDMFENLPDTIFDDLAADYQMSDLEKKALKAYLTLDPQIRSAFVEHMKKELLEN